MKREPQIISPKWLKNRTEGLTPEKKKEIIEKNKALAIQKANKSK